MLDQWWWLESWVVDAWWPLVWKSEVQHVEMTRLLSRPSDGSGQGWSWCSFLQVKNFCQIWTIIKWLIRADFKSEMTRRLTLLSSAWLYSPTAGTPRAGDIGFPVTALQASHGSGAPRSAWVCLKSSPRFGWFLKDILSVWLQTLYMRKLWWLTMAQW